MNILHSWKDVIIRYTTSGILEPEFHSVLTYPVQTTVKGLYPGTRLV